MDDQYKALNERHENAVISFSNSSMFKVGNFIAMITSAFRSGGIKELTGNLQHQRSNPFNDHNFFYTGTPCEILEPDGREWRKGKVRLKITLEFCPDQDEDIHPLNSEHGIDSDLDEIRQIANGNR